MRKIIVTLIILISVKCYCQPNEFDNANFQEAFKKLYSSADADFNAYKGDELKNDFGLYSTYYNVTLLLPGAESGKLNKDAMNTWSAIYYFKINDVSEAENKSKNIIQAIANATGKTYYPKVNSTAPNAFNYFLFADDIESQFIIFRSYPGRLHDQLVLVFEIYGHPSEIAAKDRSRLNMNATDSDIETNIKMVANELTSCFPLTKGNFLKQTGSNKEYASAAALFGMRGKVVESDYECETDFRYFSDVIKTKENAEVVYKRLKDALVKILSGTMKFSAEKQSDIDKDEYSIRAEIEDKNSFLAKDYIILSINKGILLSVNLSFTHQKK